MNKRTIRLRQACRIVVGIACMFVTGLASESMAQGSVNAVAVNTNVPADQSGVLAGCGSTTFTQSLAGYTCSQISLGGGAYGGTGFASATAGQLRASTAGSATFPGQAGVVSYASSQWTDVASLTPIGSASGATHLQIALHVTGTLSAIGGDGSGQYGGSGASAFFNASSTNPNTVDPGLFYQWTNGPGNQNSPTYAPSVDQVILMTLALSHGSTAQFQYGISMNANMVNFGNDPSHVPFIASVFSDFAHTVNPLWYHVLDANDADVTSAYDVAFAQGLTFGPEASSTPEPSSVALLGAGLLGLVPALRRRSR